MKRLHTTLLLMSTLALGACGDDAAPPQRGAPGSGGPRIGVAPAPPTEMSPWEAERQAPERSLLGPMEIRETREAEDEATPVERDLGAELRAAVGSPTTCGALGEHTTRVSIRFNAVVTENGIVTRGSVSGPSMPPETLACLQGRLERVRLAGEIENAPRSISTTLELDPVAPAPTMEAAAPTAMTPAAYGMGAQVIQGPNGRMIEAAESQGIEATMGQAIRGGSGTTIQGPSGVGIGQ